MANGINPCLVKKFSPLDKVAPQHMAELIKHSEIRPVAAGGIALKQRDMERYKCFLVRGQVEIRRSFHERLYLRQDSPQCQKPLNELLQGAGVIRAKSECQLLRVDAEVLERLSLWSTQASSQLAGYHIAHLQEGETSLDYAVEIDDSYQDDWTEAFLQSSLANHLDSAAITTLLRELDDVDFKAGQTVIQQHTPGDFFYIIKEGEARVALDRFGPQSGQFIDLATGKYFGDEALIADTPRNASVTMKTDGVLGRINRDVFEAIIKDSVISPISVQQVAQMGVNDYQCIDVRFSVEYRSTQAKRTFNVPITHLRQRLQNFKHQTTYIVGPEADRRSELGAYLLRQAGYNAFYLA
ncbi:cyclic nucleotide-binding domain-containing protein [Exilibacterium tricleocarpae]|uniref:Cyclic nucleotide-binding domain-containing protein n=1 Tax=Exilibacterium tricleocarpae TaxID=2591008 RepID=A0A545TS33_9GAMM|nr:cyclic nucleotide-binding domain-containing protein [Exilibacterium tricleocarpae]TQV80025.1 cyclic nucleotide-binding domain-containing protein [Exilibacterium tricleocarpae]